MNFMSTCCSRRDILKLTASTSLITVLSVFTSGCGRSLDSVARQMTGNLNHPEKAREIGNIYINKTPEVQQQTAEQLTENLLSSLNINSENITGNTLASLDDLLRKQIRQDFINENVVIVNGWMLSRTELMLCALATKIS